MVRFGSIMDTRTNVLKRDWIVCSNLITMLESIDKIFKVCVWVRGGGEGRKTYYNHLMNMRIFTFVMNEIFI